MRWQEKHEITREAGYDKNSLRQTGALEGHMHVVRCRTTLSHVVHDMERSPWKAPGRLCDVVKCRLMSYTTWTGVPGRPQDDLAMSSNVVKCRIRHGQLSLEGHRTTLRCRQMSSNVVHDMDTSLCNVVYDVVRHGFMSYTTWRLSPECRIRCRIMSYAKSSSRCNSPGRAHVVPHVVPMSSNVVHDMDRHPWKPTGRLCDVVECRLMSYTTWKGRLATGQPPPL